MATPPQSPRVLGVCAGIGGLELGIALAFPGARVVGYVERDAYAAAVLLARMEDEALEPAPVFAGDLHEFPSADFAGRVDLVCGGIPCQPYSVAGKQRRGDDERDLVDAFLALVRDVGPRYVFVENVAAFAADGLGRLLGGLASLGFDAEWVTLRASDVGAPHRRERVFVLGHRDGARADAHAAPGGPRQAARESGGAVGDTRSARLEEREGVGRDVEQERPPIERAGDADVADGDGDGRTEQRVSGVRQPEGGNDTDGRRAWPLPWPPGPSDRTAWASVLERDPDLAPALAVEPPICRMADGISATSHATSGGLDGHEERSTEGGTECRAGGREVLDVREAAQAPGAPSPRLRQATRRGDSVPELSQPRGPGIGAPAQSEAARMSSLPDGVQLGTQPGLDMQPRLRVGSIEPRGAAPLGGEVDAESVPRVQRDVPAIEAARQDMQPRLLTPGEVAERIEKALAHRTDRLRALGNAVVPAQAELALRILAARMSP